MGITLKKAETRKKKREIQRKINRLEEEIGLYSKLSAAKIQAPIPVLYRSPVWRETCW